MIMIKNMISACEKVGGWGEGGQRMFSIEVLTSLFVIPQGNSSVCCSRANRVA